MENQKISVIIPIYNVENYIGQCVESVLNQTYRNIQVILVDDGSPDRCGSICDEYEQTDSRVMVIHKQNGGLSDARNVGTDYADGDWILYLDSDDYLENNALEILVEAQKKYKADLVIGNFCYSYADHEVVAESPYHGEVVFNNHDAMEALMAGKLQTFAWGKLIRSSIAKMYKFPVGKLFEDHFWTHLVLGIAENVTYINTPILHYRQRDDSISFTFNISRLDVLDGWCERAKYLEVHYPDLTLVFLHNCALQYVDIAWLILTRMKKQKKEAFIRMRDLNSKLHLEKHVSGYEYHLIKALEKGDISYAQRACLYKIKGKMGL